MSEEKTITFSVQLSDEEAWQLAQFFKRATFTDFRNNAESEETAYMMVQASERVRKALADQGYDPR